MIPKATDQLLVIAIVDSRAFKEHQTGDNPGSHYAMTVPVYAYTRWQLPIPIVQLNPCTDKPLPGAKGLGLRGEWQVPGRMCQWR